jgi:asparagine synthase (glutamine-hydrolysing)
MRGIVPDSVLDRKDKIGFATPEQAWLRSLDPSAWSSIEAADRIPFLRLPALRQYVNSRIEGRMPFTAQSWRLLNFCRWFELFDPDVC